mmetsp:Transcript_75824/g.213551  ORF Transcript_75824/g.213551 Transcript_75824/m.213551 type:complete len:239 (-) Transcript_75824:684-1400(-)
MLPLGIGTSVMITSTDVTAEIDLSVSSRISFFSGFTKKASVVSIPSRLKPETSMPMQCLLTRIFFVLVGADRHVLDLLLLSIGQVRPLAGREGGWFSDLIRQRPDHALALRGANLATVPPLLDAPNGVVRATLGDLVPPHNSVHVQGIGETFTEVLGLVFDFGDETGERGVQQLFLGHFVQALQDKLFEQLCERSESVAHWHWHGTRAGRPLWPILLASRWQTTDDGHLGRAHVFLSH